MTSIVSHIAGSAATIPQRVHPATIAVHAMRSIPVLAVAYFILAEDEPEGSVPWLIVGLGVVAVIASIGAFLTWRNLWFSFDEVGDFRIDSGVLYHRQRRLALSRLQSVDIVRPFIARLFGMASVRIEMAGVAEAAAVVEYLPMAAAQALRAEVLARAAGIRSDTPAAPEQTEVRVPTAELVTSLLLRGSTMLAVIITVLGVAGVLAVAGPAGFLIVGFGVFVPVLAVFGEFTSFYNFTVARSPDGMRIRAGLFATTAQTVPPGRVHALEFSQSFLWRRNDWVRVSMNIAGSPATDSGPATPKVLLPVATRTQALALVAHLLPEWDVASVTLQPAPRIASRRAWIQHSRLGSGADAEVLVTRRGRFVRRTAVVSHARVQSIRLIQGPWQRALGLATVQAETVPGPVKVAALHLPAAQARRLADQEVARMHEAAARAAPARWMSGGPVRVSGASALPDPLGDAVVSHDQGGQA